MTAKPTIGRLVLGVLPLIVVPAAFVAALPWLTSIDKTAAMLAAWAAAIIVMSYATYLSIRVHRGLDEVQKAGAAFAAQWGMAAGSMTFVLLLMLPPCRDFAIALIRDGAGALGADSDRTVVVLALTFGGCGVVLLQAVGTLVVSSIWWRAKQ